MKVASATTPAISQGLWPPGAFAADAFAPDALPAGDLPPEAWAVPAIAVTAP
ncbi:hypothetical protein [Methylobacterium sp. WL7]|uniref:hypothetical protein n=1 Tax=Methylobacterium sp. WL7 TaxID=2603900 RepID=UPI001FEFFC25|nr:hypothetical protein [Methylobacterium sp. WL7]